MRSSNRRVRAYRFSAEALFQVLRGELHVSIIGGLPADARVAGVYTDYGTDQIGIFVESMEFDPVPEGWTVPHGELLIQQAPS